MAAPDHDTTLLGLIRYAAPIGLCENTVRVVYEAVAAEAEIKRIRYGVRRTVLRSYSVRIFKLSSN